MEFRHEGLTVRISDELAQLGLMPSGLLQNQGTFLTMVTPPFEDGEFFFVQGEGYTFRLSMMKRTVYFQRNDIILNVTSRPIMKELHILGGWGPDDFYVATFSDRDFERKDDAKVDAKTEGIFVPLKLYKWAREASLLPVKNFSSLAQFSSLLMENMKQAEDCIVDVGAHTSFWNYRKGETPKPKDEPQAVCAFAGYLRDRATLHGYEIIQEPQAGTGNLDLLAIGKHSDGSILKIAIEGKNAHSKDLLHGLQHQLPTYMRRVYADRGVYLVFWYKCDQFQLPDSTSLELNFLLADSAPFREINSHIVDVSIPISPSKREHKFTG